MTDLEIAAAEHWALLIREFDAALRREMLRDYDAFARGETRLLATVALRAEGGELRTTFEVRTLRPGED